MSYTPASDSPTLQGHVVVAQAEDDFSRVQQSLHTPKVVDKVPHQDSGSTDLEKGHVEDRQETFDLREYLTSSNDANSAAGIKHKHVGVTWEDLEVLGIGGDGNKVFWSISFPHVLLLISCCQQIYVSTYAGEIIRLLWRLFLTPWVDAVAELVTFPFVVLRNLLQPVLPSRLLQPPPVRRIIHR